MGSIDTVPKEFLGASYPTQGISEHSFEVCKVLRRTIGEGTVGLIPNIFCRIEFLTTPFQAGQKLPDVARVILSPKLLVDHVADAV
jgi:hypothetical protein